MRELLHWFLPASVRTGEREEERRALLVVAACGIAAVIALVIAAMQAAWGIWQSAVVCAGIAVFVAALPFVIRATGAWKLAAALLCGGIWLTAFSIAALTGGVMVSTLYYLVFASALAAVTLGFRTGIAVGVMTVGVVVAFYVAHVAGVQFPLAIDPELGLRSAMRGAIVFILALAALVAAYEMLRSAALRDIAESERRYRALADYGPDLIAELDSSGRILYTSAGGDLLASALIGRSTLDGVHREDQPALVTAVKQLRHQPSIRVGPLRWVPPGEAAKWFEASLTRFVKDRELRVLVVARDVTQRVELEQQLRQSQKMQAVGQLASGLAHDFNNLLMVVSGYAEAIATRAGADASACSAAEEILRATDQGAALTRRLVSLGRPGPQLRKAIDLGAVVRENERMLRVLLGESGVLLLELAANPIPIAASAGELEQVLVNLAANARDAMPNGGTLRIATASRAGRATLVVHDNGSGIDAATRERMFEPFFSTKTPGQGTGLGLYVVYSIVTSLGGEIHVVSEPGKGARISIELPLAEADAAAAAVDGVPAPRASGRGERILFVEDRAELRALVSETLNDAGYAVTLAADGVEALALGAGQEIDLVVSDVVMPRLGGIELVAALRQKRPGLRTLFVSGHPGEHAALPSGDRLLRKPFRAADLLAAVREMLAAR